MLELRESFSVSDVNAGMAQTVYRRGADQIRSLQYSERAPRTRTACSVSPSAVQLGLPGRYHEQPPGYVGTRRTRLSLARTVAVRSQPAEVETSYPAWVTEV